MSSGAGSFGFIAAAVVLPAAAAYGTGWLAWQSGKLLVEANRAANRSIEEKKRQLAAAEKQRRMAAISAHRQLVDMCAQIRSQLESESALEKAIGSAEVEQLKHDLDRICREALPDDTAKIESLTSLGYLKLEKITSRRRQLSSLRLEETASGLYRGLSVADLMDDLRVATGAMKIQATRGRNVSAADPDVLERSKLNAAFSEVTAKIVIALEKVEQLAATYGLSAAGSAWFQSCFNGTDLLIERLCKPTTSNEALKKGIRRLQEAVEQYEMMAPGIEENAVRMSALYAVYVDAAKALGEKVRGINAFQDADDIEKTLRQLSKRAERAKECAEIYRKLGPAAYLCYAWDQELRAMGYKVHSRKAITEMAASKPSHAKIGDQKMPFYQWTGDDLTQLYSIGEQCAVQAIVHDDGTVSMQTIADTGDDAAVVSEQKKHCAQLSRLHQRLRENWFVFYDFEETESPEKITSASEWRASGDFAWKRDEDKLITDQRAGQKKTGRNQQQQQQGGDNR